MATIRRDEDKPFPASTLATVGMLITKEVGSDSYAGSCVSVCGKRAAFQVGRRQYVCSLRRDGRYREVGRSVSDNTVRWVLGVAVNHLDPHF